MCKNEKDGTYSLLNTISLVGDTLKHSIQNEWLANDDQWHLIAVPYTYWTDGCLFIYFFLPVHSCIVRKKRTQKLLPDI